MLMSVIPTARYDLTESCQAFIVGYADIMKWLVIISSFLAVIFLWAAIGIMMICFYDRFESKRVTREKPDWWRWSVTPALIFFGGPIVWLLLLLRRNEYFKIIREDKKDGTHLQEHR